MTSKKFVLFFGAGLLTVALSGCAMPPKPSISSGSPVYSNQQMDSALLKSVQSIARLTDNIRATSGTRWSPHYNGFPMSHQNMRPHGSTASTVLEHLPSGSPLSEKMYAQWSGPADVFLRAMSQKMGYQYVSHLDGSAMPDIAIDVHHQTIAQVLRTIAIQLPGNYTVRVDPGKVILSAGDGQ